jgi:hypothetical protein
MAGLSRKKDYGSKKKPYPKVKSQDFAGGHRSYPIPTKADAKDALRLAGMHHRKDVKSKVLRKYPSLRKKEGGGPLNDGGTGGSFPGSKPVLKLVDAIVARNQYYKENLNKSDTNKKVAGYYGSMTSADPISMIFGLDDNVNTWNDMMASKADSTFQKDYGRKPTAKDLNMIKRRETGPILRYNPDVKYEDGGLLPGKRPSNQMTGKKNKSIPGMYTLTDRNFMDRMINLGYTDDLQSLSKMSPEERHALIPPGSPLSWVKMKEGTANQGSYRYFETVPPQSPRMTTATTYADVNDEYSIGGWLKDNLGNIGKTVGGAALLATGVGGPLGASLIASGGAGMLGSIGEGDQNEVSQVYKPAVSKSKQLYDTTLGEGGMNLKTLSKRTDYIGESHADGGINLPIGAQVEGGESRTGDIVHSDKIKITPTIMNAFKGNVPLRRGDLNKSVADIVKSRDKIFEKRSGDEWNDMARKVSQMPFEEMSDELSQAYKEAEDTINFQPDQPIMKAGGGHLSKQKARIMLHDGIVRGHPLTDKQKSYFGAVGYGEGGFDFKTFLDDPGNAPIIGSAIGAVTNLLRKPEKVKYDQAVFTPTQFAPINTEAGITQIRRSFGNSREQLRRLNPRGFMNNLANIGSQEAESIGDYTAGVQGLNARGQNEAYQMDSSNRARLGIYNTQTAMQEAEANAANRGMRKTAIDSNLANLYTQIGQKARDEKLMSAQEKYQNQMVNLQKGYQDIWRDASKKNNPLPPLPGTFTDNSDEQIRRLDEEGVTGFRSGGSLACKTSVLLNKRRFRTH